MTIMRKIERKLFWNSLLRALLETYYSTAIVFFFTMGGIRAIGQSGRMEFMTWAITGTFLFCFPFVAFRLLFHRKEKLFTQEIRDRFDSLYQNVDVYKGPIAISFSLYFCIRRLAFACVIGQVHWTIVYQILVLDVVSTLLL